MASLPSLPSLSSSSSLSSTSSPPPCLPLYSRESLRGVEAAHRWGDGSGSGNGSGCSVLMTRAAAAALKWALELRCPGNDPVLILAGAGNNGGDAICVANLMRQEGLPVITVFPGRGSALPADADAACQQFIASGGKFVADIPLESRFSLIVDGFFGIGLTRPPEGAYARLIETVNRVSGEQNCPVLALDCPSGLEVDTGIAHFPVIAATHTLTFIAAKPGLYTGDGLDCCGEIRVANLELNGLEGMNAKADGYLLGVAAFAHCLKTRRANSHKGTYGNVGILGGATAMQGAVLLAGRAALKLGAGKVYIGMIDAKAVDFLQPEMILRQAGRIFDSPLNALVCGPGMGQVGQAREILPRVLSIHAPLILDADALNMLATVPSLSAMRTQIQARRSEGFATLMTPHPAEAARLLATTPGAIQQNRTASALTLARNFQSWVVLKGCGSVIANPEGDWWINPSGNPGMAGPGFGDVLTGIIAALLGQGWPPGEALMAAVHLHGQAADDLVAAGTGPIGLTAGETIDAARARFNRWLRRDFS